jgi:hypothetical protein
MSDLHDRDDDEQMLQEQARIEKLKGPKNPSNAQAYFVPAPPTPAEIDARKAQAGRQERAARPAVLPDRVEPDFLEAKRAELARQRLHEKLKG